MLNRNARLSGRSLYDGEAGAIVSSQQLRALSTNYFPAPKMTWVYVSIGFQDLATVSNYGVLWSLCQLSCKRNDHLTNVSICQDMPRYFASLGRVVHHFTDPELGVQTIST